jgi:hypothetical protein
MTTPLDAVLRAAWRASTWLLQRTVRHIRRLYLKRLPTLPRPRPTRNLAFDVYTLLNEHDVGQGAAMIRSLLQYYGCPRRIVVALNQAVPSAWLLDAIHPCVETHPVTDLIDATVFDALASWSDQDVLRNKAGLLMMLGVDGPALYVDSDVLFHSAAASADFLTCEEGASAPRFMVDCVNSFDERIDESLLPSLPVNTGLLFLCERPDWSPGLRALSAVGALASPTRFTEQTLAALTMRSSGALPFPPDQFVLTLIDRQSLVDRSVNAAVARHYTQPVRWKLWVAVAGGALGVLRNLVLPPRFAI